MLPSRMVGDALERRRRLRIMPTSLHSKNPRHWQERAEEARALAELMQDEGAKRMMFEVADDYDNLAVQAASRVDAQNWWRK